MKIRTTIKYQGWKVTFTSCLMRMKYQMNLGTIGIIPDWQYAYWTVVDWYCLVVDKGLDWLSYPTKLLKPRRSIFASMCMNKGDTRSCTNYHGIRGAILEQRLRKERMTPNIKLVLYKGGWLESDWLSKTVDWEAWIHEKSFTYGSHWFWKKPTRYCDMDFRKGIVWRTSYFRKESVYSASVSVLVVQVQPLEYFLKLAWLEQFFLVFLNLTRFMHVRYRCASDAVSCRCRTRTWDSMKCPCFIG